MSEIIVPVGPWSGIFIGDSTATSTPLTQVIDVNTVDSILSDKTPSQIFYGINGAGTIKKLPTGPRQVSVTLEFLSNSLLMFNLNLGLSITNSSKSTPPGNNFYSVFLLADDNGSDSVFIPSCYVPWDLEENKSKSKATQMHVTLIATSSNLFTQLAYYDTITNLISIMSGQSPIS